MNIKVLAVDNNPVLLKAVSTILSQEGCRVESASTGLEALELLEKFAPDIVFTDLIMPLVSGEQLCRLLRSSDKHKNVYIVVLSAVILEDRKRIVKEIDCDLCIAKGTLQEIRLHIREALESFRNQQDRNRASDGFVAKIPKGLRPSAVATELLSEKQHYVRVLESLDEGVVECSEEGKIVSVNQAALKILQCREGDLAGQRIDVARNWGSFAPAIGIWKDEQLLGGGMASFHIVEDEPLEINDKIITATFMPVAEKDSVFGLCILRDITRQFHAEKHSRELDDAIKLVKKMDAMSCMAGGVAHDFNNLLTVICGNLDIIAIYGENQSVKERTALVEYARKSALVAVDLTRQISCFSNFGIVIRKKKNLNTILKKAVHSFFQNKTMEFDFSPFDGDLSVEVDTAEIEQVVLNVLQNAIEASSNTKVKISTGLDDFASPQLLAGQYLPAGKYGRIDIQDYGQGISPRQLFKVFDPYYSTKERGVWKGMGLGLTIVYATIRNHGGYVVVSSRTQSDIELEGEDKGTTVSMYLPILDMAKGGTAELQVDTGVAKTILFLEPDRQMRVIGELMLSHLGFTVIAVASLDEALSELAHQGRKIALEVVMAIIDVSKKAPGSPVETCRQLRKISPKLKIVAMSGTILDPIMEKCQEYGFVNSLPKPYTIDSLKHVVHSALYT